MSIIEMFIYAIGIIGGSILFGYGAIYKPMKDTLEHDKKIDNESIPDGIVAKEH